MNVFSERFLERLQSEPMNFSPVLIEQAQDIRSAPLPMQPGQSIDYIRLNEDGGPKVLYVPGFTEGILAKASTGLALAEEGLDVIVPDQNRKGTPKWRHAARLQALNGLSIVKAEEMQDEEVNLVPHSFGLYIADEMVQIAGPQGFEWSCFDDSQVIALAPGGVHRETSSREFARRFQRMMDSEKTKNAPKAFPDEGHEMLKAGQRNALKNPLRTVKEVLQLRYSQVDLRELASRVGGLTVIGYSHDVLYPDSALRQPCEAAGVTYIAGVTLDHSGSEMTAESFKATHNDEQFNPRRVAKAVASILKAA